MTREAIDYEISPFGLLVYTGDPHTEDWFAARRDGITATDVADIVSPSKWGDAASVWARKVGLLHDDDQPTGAWDGTAEPARWGTLLEPVIARAWADDRGVNIHDVGVLAHHDHPHHRASLDRLVTGCTSGYCAAEVKTRSAFTAGRWSDDVPDDVLAQVQWQMHVTGFAHEHVLALIGGNTPREYVIERDEQVIAYLIAEAERVWGHVQSMTRPDVAPTAEHLAILHRIYPDRAGVGEIDWDTAEELAARLHQARETRRLAGRDQKAATETVKAIEAEIADLLGDHAALEAPGLDSGPAFSLTRKTRSGYTVQPTSWWALEVAPELTEQS